MSDVSKVLSVIRGEISKVKIPGTYDKVYNDECMVSFDSPFSDGGLFVNMSTFLGYGVDHFLADSSKSNCRLYVHEKWTQIPLPKSVATSVMETDPTVSTCIKKCFAVMKVSHRLLALTIRLIGI
jgi:hypothetical protein